MSVDPCPSCGCGAGNVGVTGGHLCPTCLHREGVKAPFSFPNRIEEAAPVERDRNFGVGVPGLIAEECYAVRDLLHEKNKAYGNSALDPMRIFSKANSEEQIRVRIDDKLSRLARGSDAGEDVVLDLLGYLILLRIARKIKETSIL